MVETEGKNNLRKIVETITKQHLSRRIGVLTVILVIKVDNKESFNVVPVSLLVTLNKRSYSFMQNFFSFLRSMVVDDFCSIYKNISNIKTTIYAT